MSLRYLIIIAMLSCGAQADERPMIDAHSHLDSTYLEQLTIEDIIERLNRNKIDRILITSRNNNETLKLAKRIPGRIIPFASIYTAEADKANWFHSAES